MVQVTVAIADFIMILLGAIFWVAAGWVLWLGVGAAGGFGCWLGYRSYCRRRSRSPRRDDR